MYSLKGRGRRFATCDSTEKVACSRVVFCLVVVFFWSLVLAAPLRYGFLQLSLSPLVYLPKFSLFSLVVLLLLARLRAPPAALWLGGVLFFYLLWGIVNLDSPVQSFFGLWVFVPLFFGSYLGPMIDFLKIRNVIFLLFFVTALGVFLDPLVTYPWSGQGATLFGNSIEISRQWTSFGVERHAGLARSSFNAATQLLVFGLLLVLSLERWWLKVIVWFLAGAGIALTVSKGPFGGWVLLSLYFFGGVMFRWGRGWSFCCSVFLMLGVVIMILVPLSTLWISYDNALQGPMMKFFFASFGDRLSWMWPDSLGLLNLDGGFHWLTGRGLGGIGSAQQYFESNLYFPADNFFVYLAVTFGFPVAILLLLALWGKAALSSKNLSPHHMPLIIFLIAYGLVVNVIEEPLLSFFLGVVLSQNRRCYISPFKSGMAHN